MAKPKQPPSYDLKKAEQRRSQLIQIGLTAIVVLFAVGLVGFIVLSNKKDEGPPAPPAGEVKAIQVVTPGPAKLITKEGTTEPKVVLTLIEDPICPACAMFEQEFGPTVKKLIDTGAVRADYDMVGILDVPRLKRDYSSRASAAAYCVADQSQELFLKFHSVLYDPSKQPDEVNSKTWHDDKWLIDQAKGVGASDAVAKCIKDKKYINMVKELGPKLKIQATPTIRINGKDWEIGKGTTPDDLIKAVTDITGPVPGLK
ncbi:serine-threonine protein kinase [Mycobacteroides abscessus subsp. bolletii]|uniref:DsbA family protein n=1 Tax=Mycobacteroides abscessus TaxID=36809 RepID=UPI00092A9581|nr:thioredoxin domain-containing protein [Mycobacteroides abscessus]SII40484.1 serine-threonine protein kinase [Mycobacteroides abscessus subsp. bolletii]SLD47809.1 serine-threonine protein kinase [Mycobacteroides abscessus subsp. bolletii]SLE88778.1 serine-threonine protein kinase [Mycobacteroides abscessus subsp. bolletii]